jgi:uncharacterized protein with HEPN domain
MTMTRHDPLVYLLHMRDDAQEALKLSSGKTRADFEDTMFAHAMTFIVGRIDVTAAKVPPQLREKYSDIPWDALIGVRERVLASEGYRNDDLIWETICVLPELIPALEDAIEDLDTVENRTGAPPIP